MTAHTHTKPVPGCYRCELGKDELIDALAEERDEVLRVALVVWEGIDIEWSDDLAWREAVVDLGELVVTAALNQNQPGGRDS